jgi:UDP-glucose 4-epimerase
VKSILITGGAGFIGSHLTDAMLARDWRVVVLDDFSTGNRENLASRLGHPCLKIVPGSVQDRNAVRFAAKGCDAIAHLAAKKIPRYGNTLATLEVNAFGTRTVLQAARERGTHVLFASTSDCYGLNPAALFSEDSASVLGPTRISRWAYAASKLFGEHFCWAYAEEFGVPITILRYFGCYGPREHRSWWGGPQAVFIQAALAAQEMEIHGDGTQTRTFCFIDDTVAGTVAALERSEAIGQLFNVGGDQEIAIIDLAKTIHGLCAAEAPVRLRFVPYDKIANREYQDVRRRRPDLTKAHHLLGFKPHVGLEQGLQRTIAWHRIMTSRDPSSALQVTP